MLKSRRRHTDFLEVARFIAAVKMDHARWFLEGQPAQKQIVDQTKNRGVRPDRERERNNGDNCEPWCFGQCPESVFEIGDHGNRCMFVRRLQWKRASSFGTKGNNRINPRRASRRQPAGNHHRDAQNDCRANTRDEIRRRHFGPLALH